MSAIELVQIERSALEDLLYRVSKRAAADALAELAEPAHVRHPHCCCTSAARRL